MVGKVGGQGPNPVKVSDVGNNGETTAKNGVKSHSPGSTFIPGDSNKTKSTSLFKRIVVALHLDAILPSLKSSSRKNWAPLDAEFKSEVLRSVAGDIKKIDIAQNIDIYDAGVNDLNKLKGRKETLKSEIAGFKDQYPGLKSFLNKVASGYPFVSGSTVYKLDNDRGIIKDKIKGGTFDTRSGVAVEYALNIQKESEEYKKYSENKSELIGVRGKIEKTQKELASLKQNIVNAGREGQKELRNVLKEGAKAKRNLGVQEVKDNYSKKKHELQNNASTMRKDRHTEHAALKAELEANKIKLETVKTNLNKAKRNLGQQSTTLGKASKWLAKKAMSSNEKEVSFRGKEESKTIADESIAAVTREITSLKIMRDSLKEYISNIERKLQNGPELTGALRDYKDERDRALEELEKNYRADKVKHKEVLKQQRPDLEKAFHRTQESVSDRVSETGSVPDDISYESMPAGAAVVIGLLESTDGYETIEAFKQDVSRLDSQELDLVESYLQDNYSTDDNYVEDMLDVVIGQKFKFFESENNQQSYRSRSASVDSGDSGYVGSESGSSAKSGDRMALKFWELNSGTLGDSKLAGVSGPVSVDADTMVSDAKVDELFRKLSSDRSFDVSKWEAELEKLTESELKDVLEQLAAYYDNGKLSRSNVEKFKMNTHELAQLKTFAEKQLHIKDGGNWV
ncbi:hypothetical protein [uncultured Endozoicomonas sp.]|uniref:hypothetical protein n=1 Tax=uncultured Endozoicomonas sp. TaxID=432652 RepID=UPI0026168BC0|nr:hypothetical protein [uncultured Endozoicomonas sp.]